MVAPRGVVIRRLAPGDAEALADAFDRVRSAPARQYADMARSAAERAAYGSFDAYARRLEAAVFAGVTP